MKKVFANISLINVLKMPMFASYMVMGECTNLFKIALKRFKGCHLVPDSFSSVYLVQDDHERTHVKLLCLNFFSALPVFAFFPFLCFRYQRKSTVSDVSVLQVCHVG